MANTGKETWRETRRYMDYQYRYTRAQQRHEERFARQEAARNRRFQSEQAQRSMDFEANQSARQMAFQERMSNTAHQREMADMRAAGVNPVLSVSGGSGASAPAGSAGSGSAGSGDSAAVQSIASAIPQMFNAAQTFAQAQVQSAKAERERARAKVIYQKRRLKNPNSAKPPVTNPENQNNSGSNPDNDLLPIDGAGNETRPDMTIGDNYDFGSNTLNMIWDNFKDTGFKFGKVNLTVGEFMKACECVYTAINEYGPGVQKVAQEVIPVVGKEFGNIIKDIDEAQRRQAFDDMYGSYVAMKKLELAKKADSLGPNGIISGKALKKESESFRHDLNKMYYNMRGIAKLFY